MKTKEELNALKAEVETLNKKLAELSEDELKQVTGGFVETDNPFSRLFLLPSMPFSLMFSLTSFFAYYCRAYRTALLVF